MLEAVWILYDNQPSVLGRVISVFSREDRAKNCPLIQAECKAIAWEQRQEFEWVCNPVDKAGYFSIELARVD